MYEAVFSDEFKKQLKKLKRKDVPMYERVRKKIVDVLTEPEHLKHLKGKLKGEQRVHLGPFVLRFKLEENKIFFITFRHHDAAYRI